METSCRGATTEEADSIVQLSIRVQNVFTASGSQQIIGPLEMDKVKGAISRGQSFILEGTDTPESGPRLLGCTLFRPLEANHFATTFEFDITQFPSPWFFMGSVMLDPEYQGRGLGLSLVKKSLELFQQGQPEGTIFLDCWAGASKLCQYYSKLGFTFAAVVPQEDYEIAVFSWLLGSDHEGGAQITER